MRVLRSRGTELERDFAFGVVRQLFEPPLAEASELERADLLQAAAGVAAGLLGLPGAPACGRPRLRRASIPRSRSSTASTGCARISPPPGRSAWSSTTRTGQTRRRCATWPSCSRGSKSWTSRSSWRPARARRAPMPSCSRRVTTDPSAEVIRLPPLTRAAVAQLVESRLGGAPDPVFVDACLRATRGTPFLVRELVDALSEGGIAPTAEAARHVERIGARTVGRSIRLRLRRLPGACRAARAGARGPRAERPAPGGATRGPRRGRGSRRRRPAGDRGDPRARPAADVHPPDRPQRDLLGALQRRARAGPPPCRPAARRATGRERARRRAPAGQRARRRRLGRRAAGRGRARGGEAGRSRVGGGLPAPSAR